MFKASLSRRIIYWISWFSFNEIFLLALFLRVGWILSAGTIQVSDFARYDRTAIEILEGGPLVGYPWSASGTPILAAAIYSIVGYHPLVVLFLMGILGAFQAGLIYLLSKRIWKNQTLIVLVLHVEQNVINIIVGNKNKKRKRSVYASKSCRKTLMNVLMSIVGGREKKKTPSEHNLVGGGGV